MERSKLHQVTGFALVTVIVMIAALAFSVKVTSAQAAGYEEAVVIQALRHGTAARFDYTEAAVIRALRSGVTFGSNYQEAVVVQALREGTTSRFNYTEAVVVPALRDGMIPSFGYTEASAVQAMADFYAEATAAQTTRWTAMGQFYAQHGLLNLDEVAVTGAVHGK